MARTPQPKDQADPKDPTPMHPMERVDQVMRLHGYGAKPGEGVAALLRHVAAQLGIHANEFKEPPPAAEDAAASEQQAAEANDD